jgi:hypothetical protein
MKLLLTVIVLGGVASGIPYLLLRRMGGVGRSFLAYALGFLASGTTSFGVYLATHAVLPAPVLDADAVVGSGLACAVIGPALGMVAGKRVRRRAQARL